jgi:hypothetical protein
MRGIMAILSSALLAACSVIGVRQGTEEPAYQVSATLGSVQIRQYARRIAAETVVSGDAQAARGAGFRRLAGYIFGANQGGRRIAMTAPVAQARDAEGRWVIRFYLPAALTMAQLPQPSDPQLRLVEVPAQNFAVLRFSGDRSPAAVAEREAELLAALPASGWEAETEPVAWFYDPPWTLPWLRRNEVAVEVVRVDT